ncbi:hypothetical protein E3P92_03802 [Wallemia ichthyophaga]|uniref:Major facilitator superfamily (MFS) profile domain-containing protein n=2 Tax=Wallemia ichthyophaga TaxID=245174 RepID=A0A4T0HXF6_WALIC|nr:uncharacterized protein J056_002963 [Wallemia ichthyophaga EXF-994]TIA68949.1 hypothetical protein E3P91_03837 [Wallemia ichthyophaga]EOR03794.1 hypothetical protein J056_002963 [Wallemia ichthyophaga EXF-994]TIA87656.1 hypothetical protein E3P97_03842 [Wallemia ichthyophaga]TIA95194.1 hypothetical protein E3P95_03821 [Wallemia ichthyophaga]TIA96113.1 hypothetical protein E3P94_03816 [Wallemia ichthyophaga]
MKDSPEISRIGDTPEPPDEHAEFLLKAEKRVLRKIDLRILSLTALAYLLNHIDKTNLANAKIMNTDTENDSMVDQLDLQGSRFGNVILTYYCSFILAELVGNYFLKLMGPKLHISRIVISYGIVCACSAAVQSYEGMIINRFFLGLCQGGLYSGVLYYFSIWYNDTERALRFAIFVSFSTLSTAISGLIATGCSYMNGLGSPALEGFRWLFLLEGIVTVVVGVLIFFLLPDYPEDAKFLTPEERTIAVNRLGTSIIKNDDGFKMKSALGVFKQFDFYFVSVVWLLLAHGTAAFSFFAPSIINDLDPSFQGIIAQCLSVPPAILASLLTVASGYLSDRFRNRPAFILLGVVFVSCGYLILAVDKKVLVGRMAAVFLVALSNVAIINVAAYRVSIQSRREDADSTAVAVGSSASSAISNISGITAPVILDSQLEFEFKCYILMALFLVSGLMTIFCWWYYGPGVNSDDTSHEPTKIPPYEATDGVQFEPKEKGKEDTKQTEEIEEKSKESIEAFDTDSHKSNVV